MINYTTAAEAAKLIKSNDSVYIQGSVSIPEVLVKAMADRGHELRGVKVYSAFAIGREEAPYCKPEYKDSFLVYSLFVSNSVRNWIAQGYGQAIPAFLGEIPGLFRKGIIPIDVALLNCSRPNADGYCSFGTSADLAVSAAECAKVVIAQINPHVPFSYGDALIHDAVLAALGDHKHLGLHTEALTDGVVPLIRSGVIDNSQKKVLPGKNLASLALGSKRLYEYMDYNEDLIMKDVAWTNDPFRIRENPKVMAINSALEVDLTGQICADSIGTMIYSSVGGQHDFMYGGALSEGGKTFIALPSTTSKGHSKIKALLTPGAGVVTTRFQTQYVVTEYGAAYLLGKGLAERARALIDIAHPSAREELEKAACERFGYSFLRLK